MDSYGYGFVKREYAERLDQSEQVLRVREVQIAAQHTPIKLPALRRILTIVSRYLTTHAEQPATNL